MSEALGELNALLARTQDRIEAGDVAGALALEVRCQALLERIAGDVAAHGVSPSLEAAIPSTRQAFERILVLLATVKLETRVSLEEVRRERGTLGGYRTARGRTARDWTA
ncbi:MAG: hypothetical protein KDD82_27305 [Planctomycetes bacterium]|nr:hypothetical protein [Planctomycetota bacterium]